MFKKKWLTVLFISFVSTPLLAQPPQSQPPPLGEPDNMQCETISALTKDYYYHRQSGKTKQQVQETLRPDFMNQEFIRTVDLAINLAFSLPDDMRESEVQKKTFETCEQHQQ